MSLQVNVLHRIGLVHEFVVEAVESTTEEERVENKERKSCLFESPTRKPGQFYESIPRPGRHDKRTWRVAGVW